VAFREFMQKYRDRINFGTDIVITSYRAKSRSYIDDVTLSYFDMLEKEEFTLPDSVYKMMGKKAREQTDPNMVFRDMLEKEEFTLPDSVYKMMGKKAREQTNPNMVFRGLHLDDETLRMVYYDNAERIFGK